MGKQTKVDTKEIGLLITMIMGRHFLKTSDLHYGYWPDGLAVEPENLREAQDHHSNFLISHIPEGTRTILDVGGGTGMLTSRLVKLGYDTDCLCPSRLMIELAPGAGNGFRMIQSTYEDLETDKRYDLILFSESFQYVKLRRAFERTQELLNDGGHLLICDFFKTEASGKSPLSGGHRLSRFHRFISEFPFTAVTDLDITRHTAPNLTLFHDLMKNVGTPIRDLIWYVLDHNHPRVAALLRKIYQKRLAKLDHKYFSGERNAQSFERFKSYRLMLFKKNAMASA